MVEREIHVWLRDDVGYHAIQAIHGVGPTMAAIFVAEIGDVSRFPTPQHLCSWAGLTPKHSESDTKVHRGADHQDGLPPRALRGGGGGGPLPRRRPHPSGLSAHRERRGTKIARVAAARRLLTLVYWGLRDGRIRCLEETG